MENTLFIGILIGLAGRDIWSLAITKVKPPRVRRRK